MVHPSEAAYCAAVKMMRAWQLLREFPDDALGAPSPYVWLSASGREVQRFVIRREAHSTKQIHHVWRDSDGTYLGYMIHLWDPADSSSLWSLHPGRALGGIVTPLGTEVIAVSYREGISILHRPQKKWRTRRCGPPESPMVHLRTPMDAQWFPQRGDRRIDVSTMRCWQVLRCEGPRIHVTWWNHGSTRTHFKVFNARTWAQTHRGHAYIPALVVKAAPVKAPQDNVKVHHRARAAAELVQDLLAAGRAPDERALQELVRSTFALHNDLLLPITTLDRILDMLRMEHVSGQYTDTDMEALLGRIRELLARWTVDDRDASEVPVHLLRALASATRALTAGEYHKLGTIETHIQPLVDAAMARINDLHRTTRTKDIAMAKLGLHRDRLAARVRAMAEACDDPKAKAALLAELVEEPLDGR